MPSNHNYDAHFHCFLSERKYKLSTDGVPIRGFIIRAPPQKLWLAADFVERQLYMVASTHDDYCDLGTLDTRIAGAMTACFANYPDLFQVR